MSRNLLVGGLFCLGLLFVGFAATPERGRTLVNGELWNAFGGGYVDDKCCSLDNHCTGPAQFCGTKNGTDQQTCENWWENMYGPGNNKSCITPSPETVCNQGAVVVCYEQWHCAWDDVLSICALGNIGASNNTHSSCNPDCA
mgnify:CR=1 FL=1